MPPLPSEHSNSAGVLPPENSLALRFRELHRLYAAHYADFPDLYNDYLESGVRLLDMETGIISRIDEDTYTIIAVFPGSPGLEAGQTFELGNTYCRWVMESSTTVAIDCVGDHPERSSHPIYQQTKLEAYLATPIWVHGEIFGTLNVSHTQARATPFSDLDKALLEMMALSIGRAIEQDWLAQAHMKSTRRERENTELFEMAFKNAPIGIALVSPQGYWLRVNEAVSDILGYSEQELLSIDFQAITHPDDLEADLAFVQETLSGERESYRMEKRYLHKAGHIVWVQLSVSLVNTVDGEPRYFIAQIQDISEQKKLLDDLVKKSAQLELANQTLELLASKDALTKVYNRRVFDECLHEEIQRAGRTGTPVSLLMADIDYFKKYNDDFGHQAGDMALQLIADALSSHIRLNDRVARYGGEEFAIILPATDAKSSLALAERLRSAVADLDSLQRRVTISIGSATADPAQGEDVLNPKNLIQRADEALYAAKHAGRNRVLAAS